MALLSRLIRNQTSSETALPLAREIDWDFTTNQPLWRGGEPVLCTGRRAVLVWAWNALHTERFAHDVYTSDYGEDLPQLIGRPYSEQVRRSEAIRYIRETLLVNPYINQVTQLRTALEGSTLHIWVTFTTIYGEVSIDDVAL